MQSVNLMPTGYARRQRSKRRLILAGGIVVAALLALFGLARLLDRRADRKAKSSQILEREVSQVESEQAALAAGNVQLRALSEKLMVIRTLERNRRWASNIARIAGAASDEILLTRVHIEPVREKADDSGAAPAASVPGAPPPGAPAAPGSRPPPAKPDLSKPERLVLLLEGYALSNTDVYRFISKLGGTGVFEKVNFKGSEMATIDNKPVTHFELMCPLRYAPQARAVERPAAAAAEPVAASGAVAEGGAG